MLKDAIQLKWCVSSKYQDLHANRVNAVSQRYCDLSQQSVFLLAVDRFTCIVCLLLCQAAIRDRVTLLELVGFDCTDAYEVNKEAAGT